MDYDLVAYTPFETFLLLQSLDSLIPDSPAFTRVSEAMKNNQFISQSELFEPTRLEPKALKELYLQLMKEEAKIQVLDDIDVGNDGDAEHNAQKRNLLSPLIETIDEAARYTHLLPPLLNRLYFRYRDDAIKSIGDNERKYRLLQRDIQEINRGEWDARLQHQEIASKSDAKGVPSIQTLLRHDSSLEDSAPEAVRRTSNSPKRQIVSPLEGDNHVSFPLKATQDAQAGDLVDQSPIDLPEEQRRTPSGIVSRSSPQVPEVLPTVSGNHPTTEPQKTSGPNDHKLRPQPEQELNVPILHSQQVPNPAQNSASPKVEINNRRLPNAPNQVQVSVVSPRINQSNLVSQEKSSQSPIILPPPPGMLRSSGSPPGPLDALADMAVQQYRPISALSSPRPIQIPAGQPHPIQLPQPRNYPYPVYPYYDSQQAYGVPYQQFGQSPIPPYHHPNQPSGSVYHASAPNPSRGPIYGNIPLYPSPSPSYSQYPAYPHNPSHHQTPAQTQPNRNQAPRFSEPRTPATGVMNAHRQQKPLSINTSVSSTKWKCVDIPSSAKTLGSPTRPGTGDVSPISDKASSPNPEPIRFQSKMAKNQRGRFTRGATGRRGRGRGRGARAVSATSSNIADSIRTRTRSQSLLSHTDEIPLDSNVSSGSLIKPEPPATPVGDEDTEITENTADEASRKSTRRRRETLRSIERSSNISRAGIKRKRDVPYEPPTVPSTPLAPGFVKPPNHILGSRNFPRTSATIMNDISGHKLASMFAKPLTEREAPGYSDLIYRPQDLKSIKSAIMAGGKALVSAADNVSVGDIASPGPLGGGTPNAKNASTVWIPATPDVIPPKGIINSAQLEKELMRMFANAVMFNPDPNRGLGSTFRVRRRPRNAAGPKDEGEALAAAESDKEESEEEEEDEDEEEGGEGDGDVVKDTREMYEAVEKGVSDWRAAERAVEDLGSAPGRVRGLDREDEMDAAADDLQGGRPRGDSEEVGKGKRRRR